MIHRGSRGEAQALTSAWEGETVKPPVYFSFWEDGEALVFEGWRASAARIHPAARAGLLCEELWRYDTMEFFVASGDVTRYLEFNLCPNGAWWAAAFCEPRTPQPEYDAASRLHVEASGRVTADGWSCRMRVPLTELMEWGWRMEDCRMAACAVLCSGEGRIFLTSTDLRPEKPDFHRPWDWEKPEWA